MNNKNKKSVKSLRDSPATYGRRLYARDTISYYRVCVPIPTNILFYFTSRVYGGNATEIRVDYISNTTCNVHETEIEDGITHTSSQHFSLDT